MNDWVLMVLLLVFITHLVVFSVLGMRRKQWYYLALVITFACLTASVTLRIWGSDLVAGDVLLHQLLRWCAWLSAAVSIPWTVVRIVRRKRKIS